MDDILFYILALTTLGCASLVLLKHNAVTSAMFLVLTLMSLAGLFVLLQAFFIAAIQVLVYAGAVMVLFLFVIMLMDLKAEARRKFSRFGIVAGVISVGALAALLLMTLMRSGVGSVRSPNLEGSTFSLGKVLFSEYLLPFEIVSLILLVGMVGVVLLSKKEIK